MSDVALGLSDAVLGSPGLVSWCRRTMTTSGRFLMGPWMHLASVISSLLYVPPRIPQGHLDREHEHGPG